MTQYGFVFLVLGFSLIGTFFIVAVFNGLRLKRQVDRDYSELMSAERHHEDLLRTMLRKSA